MDMFTNMDAKGVEGTIKVNYEILYVDGTSDIESINERAKAIRYTEYEYDANANNNNNGTPFTYYDNIEFNQLKVENDITKFLWADSVWGDGLPQLRIIGVEKDSFEEDSPDLDEK